MKAKMTLKGWMERYNGVEMEAQELAETLVEGMKREPRLQDAPELCSAAREVLNALVKFDAELERVGFGE